MQTYVAGDVEVVADEERRKRMIQARDDDRFSFQSNRGPAEGGLVSLA